MEIVKELQTKIDTKTKPIGALGKLERIAFRLGKILKTTEPEIKSPHLLVFAADHGIAKEKVSAYPPEVTFQMVMNFLCGGAAINVFTRQHNINLSVIDAGVNYDFPADADLLNSKIAYGTKSFLSEKAMSREELDLCLKSGAEAVDHLVCKNCNMIGFGEMGIGNTSSAAVLMSYFCNLPIEDCVGKGTGLDKAGVKTKLDILKSAVEFHGNLKDPYEIMATFGGFEIMQMCGAMLESYKRNMVLLIDGFIATSALLAARSIEPEIVENCIFCHKSDEHAHPKMLEELGGEAILDLGLRLGEGTGCALAFPLIESSVEFLNKMASFDSAGVAGKD